MAKNISLFYLLLHTLIFFLLCSHYDNTFLFFFTLQHQVKPQELYLIFVCFTKKKKYIYIYIYIERERERERESKCCCFFLCATFQVKIIFFLLVSLSILQLLFPFPVTKDPCAKTFKFFTIQSISKNLISIQ